jgi:hypothetical protein
MRVLGALLGARWRLGSSQSLLSGINPVGQLPVVSVPRIELVFVSYLVFASNIGIAQ